MIETPETRYALSDGVHIAYQVVGAGPPDLVFSSGIFSNVEVMWDYPPWARFLDRLASFARLILFDMRGLGCSDRGPEPPLIELQRDDIGAVMDAVGSRQAVIMGVARAASMAMLFAATHPERTTALVAYAPVAKTVSDETYPHGRTAQEQAIFFERFVREMGTARNLALQAPSMADDVQFMRWWAHFERLVASPGDFAELASVLTGVDIRAVLSAIHVPTLVLHRHGDRISAVAQGRYVAEHIAGARFVELAGIDHLPFIGDADGLLDEVEEFATGQRSLRLPERVLATVLFTDIVGSTEIQAARGDRAWKELLERHHLLVRRQVQRFGGEVQDTAGDGFYVRFDGPARAIACAQEIERDVQSLGLQVRAGVHTGECEVADGKCTGLAVSIGARVCALAGPSELLATQTVRDLTIGSDLRFEDRGPRELKGVPDRWRIYAVSS
jgi:class 3 adenylate cyclase